MPSIRPYVPTYITVHLGAPDENAENVTVSFQDYIKNVASSEIYPTWNTAAIYANIYAQISYALNRIYTEFYRSRGYDFDITSSTAYDQKFIKGRTIFDNISNIVDNIFNEYIRRQGFIEPLAAKYCNGTTVTCEGLSQWGSENLAEEGYGTIDILKYYYGDNIELVVDAPIQDIVNSYPGTPLSEGSVGENVVIIQSELNLISQNYPAIPKINPRDGVFGPQTRRAVEKFQEIFNLPVDGIVGKATWYRLVALYTGIKRLSELNSQGQQIFGVSFAYPDAISLDDRGEKVETAQFMLSVIGEFYSNLPNIAVDGIFGEATLSAVRQFQQNNNLPVTGVIDAQTWEVMYQQYKGIVDNFLSTTRLNSPTTRPFPGTPLSLGSRGDDVRALQDYINVISLAYPRIRPVTPTGYYGENTQNAVREFQQLRDLPQTGITDEATYNDITSLYLEVLSGNNPLPSQFPGTPLRLGDRDDFVNERNG